MKNLGFIFKVAFVIIVVLQSCVTKTEFNDFKKKSNTKIIELEKVVSKTNENQNGSNVRSLNVKCDSVVTMKAIPLNYVTKRKSRTGPGFLIGEEQVIHIEPYKVADTEDPEYAAFTMQLEEKIISNRLTQIVTLRIRNGKENTFSFKQDGSDINIENDKSDDRCYDHLITLPLKKYSGDNQNVEWPFKITNPDEFITSLDRLDVMLILPSNFVKENYLAGYRICRVVVY